MRRLSLFCAALAAISLIALNVPAHSQSAPTNFASGALALSPHGAVTTLVGYSGQIVGVPNVKVGTGTLSFDGFIGGGTTFVNGQTVMGAALYPALNFGSLSVGVGLFEQCSPQYVARGFLDVSFALGPTPQQAKLQGVKRR